MSLSIGRYCHPQTERLKTREEPELGPVGATTTMTTKMVICLVGCSKRSPTEEKTKKGDSKKKPAQLKKNDNYAKQDVRVQEGAREEKCVAGPVLTRAQVKKSDKIHPLKVKEAMSSVDQATIEGLQKKDFTLKKCFDRVGNGLLKRTMLESSS